MVSPRLGSALELGCFGSGFSSPSLIAPSILLSPAPGVLLSPYPPSEPSLSPCCSSGQQEEEGLFSPVPSGFSHPLCTHGEIKDCPRSLGSCSCKPDHPGQEPQLAASARARRCLSLVGTLLQFFIPQVEIAADRGRQSGADNASNLLASGPAQKVIELFPWGSSSVFSSGLYTAERQQEPGTKATVAPVSWLCPGQCQHCAGQQRAVLGQKCYPGCGASTLPHCDPAKGLLRGGAACRGPCCCDYQPQLFFHFLTCSTSGLT